MTTIYLSLTMIIFGLNPSAASFNDLIPLYVDGTIIQAEHLEKGPVNLYRGITYETTFTASRNGLYAEREQNRVERFFIGTEDALEEVTHYNYKMLIKKYLPNARELHKRLGRVGFRFENVRYMVQFYNKFKK
jgi:hypothetical protein